MHTWKRKRKVSDFTVFHKNTHYSTYRFYLHRRSSHSCLSHTLNSLSVCWYKGGSSWAFAVYGETKISMLSGGQDWDL
ncbi:hypothetical protein CMV_011397 [Castanea mollissima]|uniref:Uncharacterized protein n=1 Tax=Castanea mollissima TaxID=60419 RepID=A0A8J4RD23_9ROSI|nr:hypothetical protein CMV_011397 [Castanea mollissima]